MTAAPKRDGTKTTVRRDATNKNIRIISYDKDATPDVTNPDVAEKLKAVDTYRQGLQHVVFNYYPRDMMAMKGCPVCKRASILTQSMQFCCRACVALFS